MLSPMLVPNLIPILTPALVFVLFPYPIARWLLEKPHVRICADQSKQHRHDLHQHRLARLDFVRTDEAFGYDYVKTCA